MTVKIRGGAALPAMANLTEDHTIKSTQTREKFWALKTGASSWEAFVTDTGGSFDKIERWTSADGQSWTQDQIVIDESGNSLSIQDPAVIIDENGDLGTAGTYYLYCEDATNGDNIRIYTSTDGVSWTHQNNFSNANNPQSPVPIIDGGSVTLIYEDFASSPHEGRYATSTDGTTVSGTSLVTRVANCVPDSVFQMNGGWWLSWHPGNANKATERACLARASALTGEYQGKLLPLGVPDDYTSLTVPHNQDGTWTGDEWVYLNDVSNTAQKLFTAAGATTEPHRGTITTKRGSALTVDRTNLTSVYPLVGDSTDVFDAESGYHGFTSGSVSRASLLGASGLTFSGGRAELGFAESLAGRDYTIGAIARTDVLDGSGHGLLCRWFGAGDEVQQGIYIAGDNNLYSSIHTGTGGVDVTTSSISANTWFSAFQTFDTSTGQMEFFVDATSVGTTGTGNSLTDVVVHFALGAGNVFSSPPTRPWDGDIAAAYIYPDRILTQSDIQTIHDKWLS